MTTDTLNSPATAGIDLNKFCAGSDDLREILRKPMRSRHGIFATNGHLMVCLPDDGGEHVTAPELYEKFIDKNRFLMLDAANKWLAVSGITLPERIDCMRCNGAGQLHKKECLTCDGDGEFEHDGHTYDCKTCDGEGYIETEPGSGKSSACHACGGTGEGHQRVEVGGTFYARKYLAWLADLPGCQLVPMGSGQTALVQFEGGFGFLMPCTH